MMMRLPGWLTRLAADVETDRFRKIQTADRQAANRFLREHAAEFTASTREQIGYVLGRLAVYYPPTNLSRSQQKTRSEDYIDDLQGIPFDLLELAAKRYRNQTGPKYDFYPRPAHLKREIADELHRRRFIYGMCEIVADSSLNDDAAYNRLKINAGAVLRIAKKGI